MMNTSELKLCKSGTWQRDGQSGYVFITCQNWDYYFDEYTNGTPDIGPDGLAYYALFGTEDDWQAATSRSATCLTEADAIRNAEVLVGPIHWI